MLDVSFVATEIDLIPIILIKEELAIFREESRTNLLRANKWLKHIEVRFD